MSKWSTFGHILEGIGRIADPRIGQVIDQAHAIHDNKGADRVSAVLAEVDTSLDLAGDISGKAAVSDPALRALAKKYIEDGLALDAYLKAHKGPAAFAPATASDLGITHGSTGE